MSAVILAIAVVGGVGLFVGIFLGIAAIRFKVEVDEKEEAVLAALPGNNCGGCGFPGLQRARCSNRKGRSTGQCLPGRWRGCWKGHRRDHGSRSRRNRAEGRICSLSGRL